MLCMGTPLGHVAAAAAASFDGVFGLTSKVQAEPQTELQTGLCPCSACSYWNAVGFSKIAFSHVLKAHVLLCAL